MRFVAPARGEVDQAVFERPPLSLWGEFAALLRNADWPSVAVLNDFARNMVRDAGSRPLPMPSFVEQTRELLGDGLHYEQRIAERGEIATRAGNWHDLLNALVWSRFPQLKGALNARQCAEIAVAGPKARTRAQCALTHFDEAGVIVVLRDVSLLALWDAHDWHGLFWRERGAWHDGRAAAIVFGHALLEHALKPRQLLVGKAIAVCIESSEGVAENVAIDSVADGIRRGDLLLDPQALRPIPLSGIPGWHAENQDEAFYLKAPCFRPLRANRRYPSALHVQARAVSSQALCGRGASSLPSRRLQIASRQE